MSASAPTAYATWQSARPFLSPWDRPMGLPADAVRTVVARDPAGIRQGFADANLVALYLARGGRVPEARSLLLEQVAAARRVPSARLWTLDALVNDARLDAIEGCPELAESRYTALLSMCEWVDDDTGLPWTRRELSDSAGGDRVELTQALAALRGSVVADLCRLWWRRGDRGRLESLAARVRRSWPRGAGTVREFVDEADVLLLVCDGGDPLTGHASDLHEVPTPRLLHAAAWAARTRATPAEGASYDERVSLAERRLDGPADPDRPWMHVDWALDLADTHQARGDEVAAARLRGAAARRALELDDHAGMGKVVATASPGEWTERVRCVMAAGATDEQSVTAADAVVRRRLREIG